MDEAYRKFEQMSNQIHTTLRGSTLLGGDRQYRQMDKLIQALNEATKKIGDLPDSLKNVTRLIESRMRIPYEQVMQKRGIDSQLLRALQPSVQKYQKLLLARQQTMETGIPAEGPDMDPEEIKVMMKGLEIAIPSVTKQFMNLIGTSHLLRLAFDAATFEFIRTSGIFATAGNTYTQRVSAAGRSFLESFTAIRHGLLLLPSDIAHIRASFQGMLLQGEVPENLQGPMQRMAAMGGAADVNAPLMQQISRLSGYSSDVAASWEITAEQIARTYDIPVNALFADMARNADLMANSAARTPKVFTEMLVNARRTGVELRTLAGFADKMTGDFDTFLEAQARLQTVMPGMDLTQAVIASQYGTEEDVRKALHAALGGQDIGAMPRSIRNMIAGAMGMSVQDVVNISKGADKALTVEENQLKSLQEIEKSLKRELLGKIISGASIVSLLQAAVSTVTSVALWRATSLSAAALLGLGSLKGTGFGLTAIASMLMGGKIAAPATTAGMLARLAPGSAPGIAAAAAGGGFVQSGPTANKWLRGGAATAGGVVGALATYDAYRDRKERSMLWTLIPGIAGAIGGFFAGGMTPMGAMLGWGAGSALGGFLGHQVTPSRPNAAPMTSQQMQQAMAGGEGATVVAPTEEDRARQESMNNLTIAKYDEMIAALSNIQPRETVVNVTATNGARTDVSQATNPSRTPRR